MKDILINYLNNIDINKINNYFISKDINLNNDELNTINSFIHHDLLLINNLSDFNIDNYQHYFSEDNFKKIKNLYHEVLIKYQHYL